jgi:hypothetical protein
MVKVSGFLNVGDTLGTAVAPASGAGVAVTTTSTGFPSTMTVSMIFSGAGAGWQALNSMLAIISIEINRNNLERILLLLFVDLNMDFIVSVSDQLFLRYRK